MPIRYIFIDAGVGGATGSGSIASVSLGPPEGSASASSVASGALVAIALGVLTATAVGTSNGSASGSLASVALSAPTGSASGTTGGDGLGIGSPAALTLTAPEGSAFGTANVNATGDLAVTTLVAPTGYAYTNIAPSPAASGGGGGGVGGNKGWDRKEWQRKKEFEAAVADTLHQVLAPAIKAAVQEEPELTRPTAESVGKVVASLTPAIPVQEVVRVAKAAADDEEDEIRMLLEENYASLRVLLPEVQRIVRRFQARRRS